MVSKEGAKCTITNSESDSESAPAPPSGASLALQVRCSLEASRQVRKRNKALQVRFKDICEAQNEQREAAQPLPYRVAYRKYMTVPARRAIPNVTRSTGVQTSPDLRRRYHCQTFPFERKKGHGLKQVAAVETYRGQKNGFVTAAQGAKDGELGLKGEGEEGGACGGRGVRRRTRALLHTNECGAVATTALEQHAAADGPCSGAALLAARRGSGSDLTLCSLPAPSNSSSSTGGGGGGRPGSQNKRQLLHLEEGEGQGRELVVGGEGEARLGVPDGATKVTGPLAWNSLTQVEEECLGSPALRSKRKKAMQLSGGCTTQAQCHVGQLSAQPIRDLEEVAAAAAEEEQTQEACKQIVPIKQQDGEVKAQLQAMENLISSSQETIKVLLGVIQELEKGEAHREGLSYRTGQDTANCDTCRNSACIIYSVELDFKQQEDKLQPLMKRLCPADSLHLPQLPYPQEAFTSTPKRKSKAESKKHARWKLWFL
ncbi:inhibitory synaptic factor 2A [Nelusetta ayraudi]|uniref:inhibitory synaptic factor 2A n=1 Tax=Nelusetta ayraudi TaxID=303726 RepID=UPI003F6ECB5C